MPIRPLLFFYFSVIAMPAISQGKPQQLEKIGLTLSLPWANNYSFYDYHLKKTVSKYGCMGIGAALFYKKGKDKFSLNSGLTGDLPAPMGAIDIKYGDFITHIRGFFTEAIYHHPVWKQVNLLAGLNYVRYQYEFTSRVNTIPSYSKRDRTIGFSLGTEYRFRKNFALALLYRPALVSFGTQQYRHLLSLDARFDINIWKNRKN